MQGPVGRENCGSESCQVSQAVEELHERRSSSFRPRFLLRRAAVIFSRPNCEAISAMAANRHVKTPASDVLIARDGLVTANTRSSRRSQAAIGREGAGVKS